MLSDILIHVAIVLALLGIAASLRDINETLKRRK